MRCHVLRKRNPWRILNAQKHSLYVALKEYLHCRFQFISLVFIHAVIGVVNTTPPYFDSVYILAINVMESIETEATASQFYVTRKQDKCELDTHSILWETHAKLLYISQFTTHWINLQRTNNTQNTEYQLKYRRMCFFAFLCTVVTILTDFKTF